MAARLRTAGAALAVLLSLPVCAAAPAAVNPYEATVAGEPSGELRTATIVEALKQVAVRATGRRAAATDPALAGLYAGARQYVQTLTPASPGQVTVGFDAAAVEPALARAGQPLWNGERPLTLVVLLAANGQLLEAGSAAEPRRQLEHAAAARGVALVYPTRAASEQLAPRLEDVRRGELAPLLELAHRYGAEELLLGTQAGSELHYAAAGRVALGQLPGSAEDALHALVDRYAADGALAPGTALSAVVVELHGINDARAYAGARRALEALGPVRSVSFTEADHDVVRVAVTLRGSADALRRALSQAPHVLVDSAPGAETIRMRLAP